MRGSAKKSPSCMRENAGVSPTPWKCTPWKSWATPPLRSNITTQLHIHPALSPASSKSFPAWLPPVLIFLSSKSLSHSGRSPASPFSATQPPFSVSLTCPLLALPPALPWPSLSRALSSHPGPSISSSSGSGPHCHKGPAGEGCRLTHSPLSAR